MKKILKKELIIAILILLIGQLIFYFVSPGFLKESYVNRIYATTAVKHKSEDLHLLNEAAHYFGQTMIGWLKFPHFMTELASKVDLPQNSQISAHIQERQNIIFEVITPLALPSETLEGVKAFIQSKIDSYNLASATAFNLTNLDYEQITIKKTYSFGAAITFTISVLIILGLWFLRREFRLS